MDARTHREKLLAALRESLGSGDLEGVKRASDSLHKVGGDPVAALSSMVLDELPDGDQRMLAMRALEQLDSTAARLVAERDVNSTGNSNNRNVRADTVAARQSDSSKLWISGALIALAFLWPAYSIYHFDNPSPSEPPKPVSPWTDQEVEMESRMACETAVLRQLRDPDSAEFPSLSPSEVHIEYARVTVRGYVHASNGLGLKVRADYLCTIQVDRQAHTASVQDAQLVQQ